jgi:cytochrome c553
MKYKFGTSALVMGSALICLMVLSSVAFAVPQSGSCPAGHLHKGHGMSQDAETGRGGNGIRIVEKLADAECSSCHGAKGISVSGDVPNLAGQQFMYLCAWLDGCRTQGEKCEGHEDIAAKLTDQEIVDLSEFYAHITSDNQETE